MTMLDERFRGTDPAAGLPGYSARETEILLARIRAEARGAAVTSGIASHTAIRVDDGGDASHAVIADEDGTSPVVPEAETFAEVRSGTHAGTAAEVVTSRRQRPVRWIVLAAAVVLTIAMMVVPTLLPGPAPAGATKAAAEVLDRAKLAAVDPPARPDQYWKTTTRSTDYDVELPAGEGGWSPGDPDTVAWMRQVEQVTWARVDGEGPTWILTRTGPYFWQAGGPPAPLPVADWTVVRVVEETWTNERPQDHIDLDPSLLPTDPVELRQYLREYVVAIVAGSGGATPTSEEENRLIASQAAEILRRGFVTAALSQALFEVLKDVPGIDVADPDTTFDGRRAVTLGARGPYGTHPDLRDFSLELAFDQETGRYLGDRMVLPNKDVVDFPVYRDLVDEVAPEIVAAAIKRVCTDTGTGTTCTETIP